MTGSDVLWKYIGPVRGQTKSATQSQKDRKHEFRSSVFVENDIVSPFSSVSYLEFPTHSVPPSNRNNDRFLLFTLRGSQNAALGEWHGHGLESTIWSAVAVVTLGSRFDHGVVGAHTALLHRHQQYMHLFSFVFCRDGLAVLSSRYLLSFLPK
jgi:hypothetical protein